MTLQRLKDYGVKVCKDKFEFFQHTAEYSDLVIDANGLHKIPEKVKARMDNSALENISYSCSFLPVRMTHSLSNYNTEVTSKIFQVIKKSQA